MIKVLILEDDLIFKEILEQMLIRIDKDIKTYSYPNVDSAVKEIGPIKTLEKNFNLIITDVFLAGDVTGIQLVSNLSSEAQEKVIICSGIKEEEFQKIRQDYKINGGKYFEKPLQIKKLISHIKTIISDEKESKNNIKDINSYASNVSENYIIKKQNHRTAIRKPVILITGCSSGIGMELAKKVSKNEYYKVVLTAREKSLSLLKNTFQESDRLMILPLDLTNFDQINQTVSTILRKWGSVDVLINNAGICYRSVTEQMDFDSEMLQMKTNFLGPMAIIRTVIPVMRENGRGKIINVSSVSGVLGMPTMGSYSASKHALEGASESLWYELKPFGINVTLVRPGFINSEGHTHVCVSKKAQLAEKLKGPYHDFYSFMRPFVARLMKLSRSTSEDIANEIIKVIQTQNPSYSVNVTFDAKVLTFFKKVIPIRQFSMINNLFFSKVSHWGIHSKANPLRRSIFARWMRGIKFKNLDKLTRPKQLSITK